VAVYQAELAKDRLAVALQLECGSNSKGKKLVVVDQSERAKDSCLTVEKMLVVVAQSE